MKSTLPLRVYLLLQLVFTNVMQFVVITGLVVLFLYPRMQSEVDSYSKAVARAMAGQIVAMLGAAPQLGLGDVIKGLSVDSHLRIMILDWEHRILADTQAGMKGRRLALAGVVPLTGDQFDTTSFKSLLLNNGRYVGAVTALPTQRMRVMVVQTYRHAMRFTNSVFWAVAIGLAISFVIGLAVIALRSNKLAQLVLGYTRRIQTIAEGNYDIAWPSSRTTEFETLTRNLTHMSQTIRNREQDLEANQARYRSLFDEAPIMYVVTQNQNGKPLIWDINERFLKVLGYRREDVLGTCLAEYYTPGSKEALYSDQGYQRAMNGAFDDDERSLVTCQGQIVHTLLRALPEIDPNGKVVGTRAMFLDITARKAAEEETHRLEEALRQSQKMEAIGTLAGGIAHDFNNILAGVMGYAELGLMQTEKGTRLHDNLQQLLLAGRRASDLVKQILMFSRQEERQLKPLQVEPLVKEALKLLRSSLPSTIEIAQQIDSGVENVMADPTQVHQIVINLCTNAAQAMEEGGQLTVSLTQTHLDAVEATRFTGLKPGKYIKLAVTDTGQGIPPALLENIFDPYFTTKEKGKGTGLGLAVVHGIVQSYGGAVLARSGSGVGSTFTIYLPAIKQVQMMEGDPEVKLPKGTERILLVDDEPTLIEVGQQMLEQLGYQVQVCNQSPEGLVLFREDPQAFDLVISDITMPKIAGDKLAAEMLKTRPDLPIILSTGYAKTLSDEDVQKRGIKALLMKPFAANELALLVRNVLDSVSQGQT